MSRQKNVARKYVPGQVLRLQKATALVNEALDHVEQLQEKLWLDVVDGWSTQDPVLDFAIVAGNGIYDESVLNKPYQLLHSLPQRAAGKKVLIVQMSEYWKYDDPLSLRNIYFGQLRNGAMDFNIDLQIISIPLVAPYVIFREFIQNDQLIAAWAICDENRVKVGPLRNEYCGIDYSQKNEVGNIVTPLEAVCDVIVHPWDTEQLLLEYGIEDDMLQHLIHKLIRAQNEPVKGEKQT